MSKDAEWTLCSVMDSPIFENISRPYPAVAFDDKNFVKALTYTFGIHGLAQTGRNNCLE